MEKWCWDGYIILGGVIHSIFFTPFVLCGLLAALLAISALGYHFYEYILCPIFFYCRRFILSITPKNREIRKLQDELDEEHRRMAAQKEEEAMRKLKEIWEKHEQT